VLKANFGLSRTDERFDEAGQWEDWDRDMLPLPTDAVARMSNPFAMLW